MNKLIFIILLLVGLAGCYKSAGNPLDGLDTEGDLGEPIPDMVFEEPDVESDIQHDGPVCGNGILESDEECDDGNRIDGDGCEGDCTWTCETNADCSDGNICNGEETCITASNMCEAGTVMPDGMVCRPDPRSICLGGSCQESRCGDGFVDPGAGEFCEPPGEGGCDDACHLVCDSDPDCPDDSNICNGEEYCNITTHVCDRLNIPADGTECGSEPRQICIGGSCQESLCGDLFIDPGNAEECDDGQDGDLFDGCRDDCVYSCHDDSDCLDENLCNGEETCGPVTTSGRVCDPGLPLPDGTPCNPDSIVCTEDYCTDGYCAHPIMAGKCLIGGSCWDESVNNPSNDCESCRPNTQQTSWIVREGEPCDDDLYCTPHPETCTPAGTCGTLVDYLYGVEQIDGGEYHSCIKGQGNIARCWGGRNRGQIGDGVIGDAVLAPVDVVGLTSDLAYVSAGREHTCAVTASTGGVKCWGDNIFGQIGDGTNEVRTAPVDVLTLTSQVAQVCAGGFHSCAVTTVASGGYVWCWGMNDFAELGNGTMTDSNMPVQVQDSVHGGMLQNAIAISCGYYYSCALLASSEMMCWGDNAAGQLGDDTAVYERTTAVHVVSAHGSSTPLSGVQAIALGRYHTCALLDTNMVKCWGINGAGQLGDGTRIQKDHPVDVTLPVGAVSIATGGSFTCAQLADGTLNCWGGNNHGELGMGDTPSKSTPDYVMIDPLNRLTGVTFIGVGIDHACAFLGSLDNTLRCWGRNDAGQLGTSDTVSHSFADSAVYCQP